MNYVKKYASVLQQNDKMGTVFTTHQWGPFRFFYVLDTTLYCSQLYVHDVCHVCYYIPFYIYLKKVIIVVSADSVYVQFIDHK